MPSNSKILLVTRDLLLELLDVSHKLLAGGLEEEVAVCEPGRVAETHKLEHLGEQGDAVEGVDDGGGQPDRGEGGHRVDNEGGLVLHLLPLQLKKNPEMKVTPSNVLERRFKSKLSPNINKTYILGPEGTKIDTLPKDHWKHRRRMQVGLLQTYLVLKILHNLLSIHVLLGGRCAHSEALRGLGHLHLQQHPVSTHDLDLIQSMKKITLELFYVITCQSFLGHRHAGEASRGTGQGQTGAGQNDLGGQSLRCHRNN